MSRTSLPNVYSDYNVSKFKKQFDHSYNKNIFREKVRSLKVSAQRELVEELNEVALYLYNYYVSTIGNKNIDLLDDNRVAKVIGWTTRKTKDNRLKLTNAGYIKFIKSKRDNVEIARWILGKEEVANYEECRSIYLINEADIDGEKIIDLSIKEG